MPRIIQSKKYFKSFYIVKDDSSKNVRETWPEDVILGRYSLNEEARAWIKTLGAWIKKDWRTSRKVNFALWHARFFLQ